GAKALQSPSSMMMSSCRRSGGSGSSSPLSGASVVTVSNRSVIVLALGLRGLIPIIGLDDTGDEAPPHHIRRRERAPLDSLAAGQKSDCHPPLGRPDGWHVDLARTSSNHHFRVLTEASEKHLQLHAGRSLRLIQNNIGGGERTSTH